MYRLTHIEGSIRVLRSPRGVVAMSEDGKDRNWGQSKL